MSEQKKGDEKAERRSKLSTTRRNFLKYSGGAFVAFLGIGGAGKLLKREALLRPPGGQDEANFIAKCIKCDRCRSICPTSAIVLADLSHSVLDARTPMMNFHSGYCDFCNKCVEVCPTQALKEFDKDTVKIGLAVIKKDICIAWNSVGCTVCKDECPYDAITLDEQRRPVVNIEKCNGCGLCVKVCPALVMRSYVGGKVRGIEVEVISKREGMLFAWW